MLVTNTGVPGRGSCCVWALCGSSSSAVVHGSGSGLHWEPGFILSNLSISVTALPHSPGLVPLHGSSLFWNCQNSLTGASPPTQPTLWFIDMCFIPCLGFEFVSVEVLLCRKWLVPVPTITLCHFYLYALSLALTKPWRLWNWRIKK